MYIMQIYNFFMHDCPEMEEIFRIKGHNSSRYNKQKWPTISLYDQWNAFINYSSVERRRNGDISAFPIRY